MANLYKNFFVFYGFLNTFICFSSDQEKTSRDARNAALMIAIYPEKIDKQNAQKAADATAKRSAEKRAADEKSAQEQKAAMREFCLNAIGASYYGFSAGVGLTRMGVAACKKLIAKWQSEYLHDKKYDDDSDSDYDYPYDYDSD